MLKLFTTPLSIAVIIFFLTASGGFVAPAAAPAISLSPSSGPPGAGVTLNASGFTPGESAEIAFDGSVLTKTTSNSKGAAQVGFTVPAGAAQGGHKVSMTETNTGASASTGFTVTAPPSGPPVIKSFTLAKENSMPGECVLILWETANAVKVTLSGDFGDLNVETSGNAKVCPKKTWTYVLYAHGGPGASPQYVSARVTLTVFTITLTPSLTYTPTATRTPTLGPSLTPRPVAVQQVPALRTILNAQPCSNASQPGAQRYNFDSFAQGQIIQGLGIANLRSSQAGAPISGAHSGRMGAVSVPNVPIEMNFTTPVRSVSLYVGRSALSPLSSGSILAVLTGYLVDAGGRPAETAASWALLQGRTLPINTCLQVTAPANAAFTLATLDYVDGRGVSSEEPRWMDDFTYVPVPGQAAADEPPRVRILNPGAGRDVTTDNLTLRVEVDEDRDLGRLQYSLNGGALQPLTFTRQSFTPSVFRGSAVIPPAEPRPRTPTPSIPGLNARIATNTIRVVAADRAGQTGEASVRFRYMPASRFDVSIVGMEVTQGVQALQDVGYIDNSIPIFTNKLTMVRVYLEAETPLNLPRVNGALCLGEADAGGCTTLIRPIAPVQLDSSHVTYGFTDHKGDLSKTLNYILPMAWVAPPAGRSLTLTAFVNYLGEDVAGEPDQANNRETLTFGLHQPATFHALWFPLTNGGHTGNINLKWDIAAGLASFFPISAVNMWETRRGPLVVDGDLSAAGPRPGVCSEAWSNLLEAVDDFRDEHNNRAYIYYQAILNNASPHGGTAGCGGIYGWSSSIIPLELGVITPPPLDRVNNFILAAHEFGHSFGRPHSPGGNVGTTDSRYPVSTGLLDLDAIDIPNRRALPKAASYDFMNYMGNHRQWISGYNYHMLSGWLGSAFAYPGTSISLLPDLRNGFRLANILPQAADFKYISGNARVTPTSARLTRPLYHLTRTEPYADSLPPGKYTLELQNGAGLVLARESFGPPLREGEPESDEGSVHFILPWVEGGKTLVFRHLDQEIARVSASAGPPKVTLLSPNGGETWGPSGRQEIAWQGSDPDKDALVYNVQYSADGGQTWSSLGSGLKETRLTADLSLLPGGSNCLVRVTASDGFLGASDVSDAPFTVPAKGPQIRLTSPRAGEEFYKDGPVVLSAMSSDPQDGSLPDAAFSWTSDRDGGLGSGGAQVVHTLSLGDHILSLTAKNSAGISASAQVKIRIIARPPSGPNPEAPGAAAPAAQATAVAPAGGVKGWFEQFLQRGINLGGMNLPANFLILILSGLCLALGVGGGAALVIWKVMSRRRK